MKTTIDIPDALADEAKRLVRAEGTTLRDLVVSGLRTEIERRSSGLRPDFTFPTVSGKGLVVDLAARDVIDRSYGFEASGSHAL